MLHEKYTLHLMFLPGAVVKEDTEEVLVVQDKQKVRLTAVTLLDKCNHIKAFT